MSCFFTGEDGEAPNLLLVNRMATTLEKMRDGSGLRTMWGQAKRRSKHVVHLFWRGTDARTVDWVGDANGWQIGSTPYTKEPSGWRLVLELPHGHHRYLVVVDGKPMLDPESGGTVRDESGSTYSIVAVS